MKLSRKQRQARYKRLRPLVRAKAWRRDAGRCVWPTCRRAISLDDAHIHEVLNRSLGGDATNVNECVTTCPECHNGLHVRVGGKTKMFEAQPSMFGGMHLRCFERQPGEDEWRSVGDVMIQGIDEVGGDD